jgi:hypothetical protein
LVAVSGRNERKIDLTNLRAAVLLSFALLLSAPLSPARSDPPHRPEVTVDTSQLDIVQQFARKAGDMVTEWYPRIVHLLGAERATPPERVTILMDVDMDGVAATGGDGIHVSVRYVQKHPDDAGMIVHELAHVVQAYPKYDPVWLVEGIADYIRFYYYEPEANRPRPDPKKANCRDSYRTTAAFLDWAVRRYDADLVKKLDQALKAGTYSDDLFRQATGKSLDQLNTEWIASLK